MKLKGIIFEDFINYKKPSMVLEFPTCSFKCDRECDQPVCQNSTLVEAPNIEITPEEIVRRYLSNPIVEAIVCQGLEPFDSWQELLVFVATFRIFCHDDIVIYTGYTKEELKDKVGLLAVSDNIVIKYGRYIPGQEPHYDEVLGVQLASNNQYAEKIS